MMFTSGIFRISKGRIEDGVLEILLSGLMAIAGLMYVKAYKLTLLPLSQYHVEEINWKEDGF